MALLVLFAKKRHWKFFWKFMMWCFCAFNIHWKSFFKKLKKNSHYRLLSRRLLFNSLVIHYDIERDVLCLTNFIFISVHSFIQGLISLLSLYLFDCHSLCVICCFVFLLFGWWRKKGKSKPKNKKPKNGNNWKWRFL